MPGKAKFVSAMLLVVCMVATGAHASGPPDLSIEPNGVAPAGEVVRLAQAVTSNVGRNSWPRHTNSDEDTLLRGQNQTDANAGTVTIMTTRNLGAPFMQAALDLSNLLDQGERFERMRVVPVISRGTVQNLWDILYLRGIDMGFIQSDILEYLKDDPRIETIKNQIRFITVMYPEEVHIVASAEIKSLKDLAGKTVSIDAKGTGASVVGTLLMERLGIPAVLVNEDSRRAISRLKKGEISAHIFVLAKPTEVVANIKNDGNLHLLPVPFDEKLAEVYLPSTLTAADYPNLIREGETVNTIAVGNVLATFKHAKDSLRGAKVKRFVDSFFLRFEELKQEGFHEKWKDVNIAATMPGWTRLEAAQAWLDAQPALPEPEPVLAVPVQREPKPAPVTAGLGNNPYSGGLMRLHDEELMRQRFAKFLAERGVVTQVGTDGKAVNDLFEEFSRWQASR